MSDFIRKAKRHSEQAIGSLLKLEDLAECIMLTDVNGFIVEFDDPTGQQYVTNWVKFGVMDIPIRISYVNGSPFLRARYIDRTRLINVYTAGDSEENVLFAVQLPPTLRGKYTQHPATALASLGGLPEKRLSTSFQHQQNEIAKLKHKTGLTVYKINRATPLTQLNANEASDLQIVLAKQTTVPFLDMRVERTCCSVFLNWLGLAFDNAQFACYKRDQFIGTVRPKTALGPSQLGYIVKFQDVPAPAHVPKAIILASTMVMLLNLATTICGKDDMMEE